jgi:hypothetical protein
VMLLSCLGAVLSDCAICSPPCRYEEFTEGIVTGLKQSLMSVAAPLTPQSQAQANEEEKDVGRKKRIQTRFALELFQVLSLLILDIDDFDTHEFRIWRIRSVCGRMMNFSWVY